MPPHLAGLAETPPAKFIRSEVDRLHLDTAHEKVAGFLRPQFWTDLASKKTNEEVDRCKKAAAESEGLLDGQQPQSDETPVKFKASGYGPARLAGAAGGKEEQKDAKKAWRSRPRPMGSPTCAGSLADGQVLCGRPQQRDGAGGGGLGRGAVSMSIAVGLLSNLEAQSMAFQLGPASEGGADVGPWLGFLAVLAFALSSPGGAVIGLNVAASAPKAWAILIHYSAGMLFYIGFYKYCLPPTKGRLNNVLLYLLFFAGLMLTYLLQPRTHPLRLANPPLPLGALPLGPRSAQCDDPSAASARGTPRCAPLHVRYLIALGASSPLPHGARAAGVRECARPARPSPLLEHAVRVGTFLYGVSPLPHKRNGVPCLERNHEWCSWVRESA